MAVVRSRFAPSPTGYLHVGGARTALYAYLVAKKAGGQFILRIEDTDRERSTEESVNAILEGMAWLGLKEDEGPFYQTHRMARYDEVIEQFLAEGKAYRCNCSRERLDKLRETQMAKGEKPRYDGHCLELNLQDEGQDHVVRFKNPKQGKVHWNDLVKGEIGFDNAELDDLIIKRTDGSPTYNFTVVIDDWDMQITQVIRGDDHVNNTPRQINLYHALSAPIPAFAHVPMILGDDGKRLSKRHGAVGVMEYRERGYLPEAVLNYLIRLGWSHGDQEIFSISEMVDLFDLKSVNRAPSAFNTSKLNWLNQHYLKTLPYAQIESEVLYHFQKAGFNLADGPKPEELIPILADRAETLVDLAAAAHYFYQDFDAYEEKAKAKFLKPPAKEPLSLAREKLSKLEDWSNGPLHQVVQDVAEALEIGMGKIGMPLRVAITGGGQSPGIDDTLRLLGKAKVLERLDHAIASLG